MIGAARSRLSAVRYALPGLVERHVAGPGVAETARLCTRLHAAGFAVTTGYFNAAGAAPLAIAATYAQLAEALTRQGVDTYLSVKAPQLQFAEGALAAIAAAGLPLVLDAHAPAQADATLALAQGRHGVVLPARWQRSVDDAERLRDAPVRLRLVKGEWADPEADPADRSAAYLKLVTALAGRGAPVAVATHDPELAARALTLLLKAGTPAELEQLRGLPRRRTVALARALGVPVRVYVPFGPGWWPYALDQALARPWLPAWWLRDRFSRPGGVRRSA